MVFPIETYQFQNDVQQRVAQPLPSVAYLCDVTFQQDVLVGVGLTVNHQCAVHPYCQFAYKTALRSIHLAIFVAHADDVLGLLAKNPIVVNALRTFFLQYHLG